MFITTSLPGSLISSLAPGGREDERPWKRDCVHQRKESFLQIVVTLDFFKVLPTNH